MSDTSTIWHPVYLISYHNKPGLLDDEKVSIPLDTRDGHLHLTHNAPFQLNQN